MRDLDFVEIARPDGPFRFVEVLCVGARIEHFLHFGLLPLDGLLLLEHARLHGLVQAMDCSARVLIEEVRLGFGGGVAPRGEDARQVVLCLRARCCLVSASILVWPMILLNDLPQHVVVPSEALCKARKA